MVYARKPRVDKEMSLCALLNVLIKKNYGLNERIKLMRWLNKIRGIKPYKEGLRSLVVAHLFAVMEMKLSKGCWCSVCQKEKKQLCFASQCQVY